jgi:hypothetical protein
MRKSSDFDDVFYEVFGMPRICVRGGDEIVVHGI